MRGKRCSDSVNHESMRNPYRYARKILLHLKSQTPRRPLRLLNLDQRTRLSIRFRLLHGRCVPSCEVFGEVVERGLYGDFLTLAYLHFTDAARRNHLATMVGMVPGLGVTRVGRAQCTRLQPLGIGPPDIGMILPVRR